MVVRLQNDSQGLDAAQPGILASLRSDEVFPFPISDRGAAELGELQLQGTSSSPSNILTYNSV